MENSVQKKFPTPLTWLLATEKPEHLNKAPSFLF